MVPPLVDPTCMECGARMGDAAQHAAYHRGLIEAVVRTVLDAVADAIRRPPPGLFR